MSDLDAISALVTVVTGPAAVLGVFLVYKQLRAMQSEAEQAHERDRRALETRAAKILPLVDVLRDRVNSGWGCDIFDARNTTDPATLVQFEDAADADIAVAGQLIILAADTGIRPTVIASMIETDLKIVRYYLRDVSRHAFPVKRWEQRWPQMIRVMRELMELARILQRCFPQSVATVEGLHYNEFRVKLTQEVKAVVRPEVDGLIAGTITWLPHEHPSAV